MKKYFLYILTDKKNGSLHIDITDDIVNSVIEFKKRRTEFLKKKDRYFLVYYEEAGNIKYKKKMKRWKKFWLDTLIDKCNPQWDDLNKETEDINN